MRENPQVQERIALAVRLLSCYHRPSEVFAQLRKQFPESTTNQRQYAVEKARELIRESFDESHGDALRAKSVIFYLSLIRDEDLDLRHRLRAQENLDKLLALHKPKKGAESVDVTLQAFLAEQLERMREEGQGT
jgi:hypothetical protein